MGKISKFGLMPNRFSGGHMKFKNRLLLGVVWGAISMAQSAAAAEIKVLTTGAFKQVVVALIPEFEKATGHKVVLDNGTVGQLQLRLF